MNHADKPGVSVNNIKVEWADVGKSSDSPSKSIETVANHCHDIKGSLAFKFAALQEELEQSYQSILKTLEPHLKQGTSVEEESNDESVLFVSRASDQHHGAEQCCWTDQINPHGMPSSSPAQKQPEAHDDNIGVKGRAGPRVFEYFAPNGPFPVPNHAQDVDEEKESDDQNGRPVSEVVQSPLLNRALASTESSFKSHRSESMLEKSTRFQSLVETIGQPLGTNSDQVPAGRFSAVTERVIQAVNGPPRNVIPDAKALKENVRRALAKPEYDVCDYYWTTGLPQRIARDPIFEHTTLCIICLNAIWISIDADLNPAPVLHEAPAIFQIAEHFFCVYFSGEWLLRLFSFRNKANCIRDSWFVFDGALVCIMVMETWVLTLIFVFAFSGSSASGGLGSTSVLKLVRLVRIVRMARMAKLLRAMPELSILIKGLAIASRGVFFTMFLLLIMVYFFAIVFRQLSDGQELGQTYFKSVPDAMISLFLDGVLPDQADIVKACGDTNTFYGFLMLVFLLASYLMIMNLLVGLLCEVVSVVAAVEKETLMVTHVKQRLLQIFTKKVDKDGEMEIDKTEFDHLLQLPEAAQIISELGVDVVGLVDVAEYIFSAEHQRMSFADFMELVLSLRGSNQCTVKDVVDLRKFFLSQLIEQRGEILDRVGGVQQDIVAFADLLRKVPGVDQSENDHARITNLNSLTSCQESEPSAKAKNWHKADIFTRMF